MAQSNQIQSISHTHEQVMNWLIANPQKKLRECAEHFQYTQTWLSIMIHSDIFQAKLKEKQSDVFLAVMEDVPAKLRGLADVVVEQLGEQLTKNTDKDYTLDAFDKIMHRAGYAPASAKNPFGGQPQVQNNLYVVSADVLAQARASMAPQALEKNVESVAVEVEVEESPAE
jgi:hypothetical protein